MKRRVLLLSLLLAAVVYGVLFTYVFAISPAIKGGSVASWLEKETSKELKYRQAEVCSECHAETYKEILGGSHATVECENCHGAGVEHTIYRTADSITIDDSREACMVCHKSIPGRTAVETVDDAHHPGVKCAVCHNPHNPG